MFQFSQTTDFQTKVFKIKVMQSEYCPSSSDGFIFETHPSPRAFEEIILPTLNTLQAVNPPTYRTCVQVHLAVHGSTN